LKPHPHADDKILPPSRSGPRPLRPIAVQLDGLNDANGSPRWFAAFTNGEHWNGFATPYFEKSVGDAIVAAFNTPTPPRTSVGTRAWYDAERDAFVFQDEEDDEEAFAAVRIDGRTLYPIGAWFWTWSSNEGDD